MRILFLYTELADYSIACLKAVKAADHNTELMVIHFPINPEAPFRFDFGNIGKFICIQNYADYSTFNKDAAAFKADKVVCSGWINKWYLRFCLSQRTTSLCIILVDNIWHGNLKQQIFRILSRLTLNKIFKKIWVPGPPQMIYAKKIGYRPENILTGYYSCDIDKFKILFEKFREQKKMSFPHRFICVARYIPEKGYNLLWQAFVEWKAKTSNDWELWCAGTGAHFNRRIDNVNIKHLGFVQKDEWENVISNTGIFVLASLYEPWGVVVHEFSASGYPLLLSNKVGAGSVFLKDQNGFVFDPNNREDLIQCFEKISRMSDEELSTKGFASYQFAQQITPELWACTLLKA